MSLKHSCNKLHKIKLVLSKYPLACPENETMQTKTRKENKGKQNPK